MPSTKRLALGTILAGLLLVAISAQPLMAQSYDTSINEPPGEPPRLALAVAPTAEASRAAAEPGSVVGYYEMCTGSGPSSHVAPILTAGGEPSPLTDLSSAALSGVDVLFITNCDNNGYSSAYLARLPDVSAFVAGGGVLIIHDRHVTGAATILPGGAGISTVRATTSNINVRDGSTLVTDGPGGVITNTTLNGGNHSAHGHAPDATLPEGATLILTAASSAHIVTFAYPYVGGYVVYSSIPLDHYLSRPSTHVGLGTIYPANVVAYGLSLVSASPGPEPPVASAGVDQTIECGGVVTLDGSGSSDPGGEPLTYEWTDSGGNLLAEGVSPSIALPLGEHVVTLTVTNASGYSDSDTVTISVADTTPPQLSVPAGPITFWPANGTMRTIDLAGLVDASDVCDAEVSHADVLITHVASDENGNGNANGDPEAESNGNGDVLIAGDCRSVDVRARRHGHGDGRVYTINVFVEDASGNRATDEIQVHVPPNPNRPASRGPDAYAVASDCGDASAIAPPDHLTFDVNASPEYGLDGAFPNPLRTAATIRFELPRQGAVRLTVFDVTGREVVRLLDGQVSAGRHDVLFDATGLPSGVYIYRLEADGAAETRRMVLAR